MLVLLLACDTPDPGLAPADPFAPGRFGVGHAVIRLGSAEGRTVDAEVWTPADTAGIDPIEAFVPTAELDAWRALTEAAPSGCPATDNPAAAGAALAEGGPWPLVAMSHCTGCTRFSNATVAAHLASHGYVVVAPDHAGDTLYDTLAGTDLPLDTDTLALRAADLEAAIDAGLGGELGATVDPARVGVYGHSFGAVTAGLVLQERAEVGAAAFVGAPPDNPFLPGVDAAAFAAPTLFVRLMEDHSVGAAGNLLIDGNFEETAPPTWRADYADAGHWSPSDLVGVTDDFLPGCGEDTREATGEPFAYPEPAHARAVTAGLAAAFFAATLDGDTDARAALDEGQEAVVVESR